MGDQLAYVPLRAVGGPGPVLGPECVDGVGDALVRPESTEYAASSIADYAERTEQTVTAWKAMNGQQGGDPAKLADAVDAFEMTRSRPPVSEARLMLGDQLVATTCDQSGHRWTSTDLSPGGRRPHQRYGPT